MKRFFLAIFLSFVIVILSSCGRNIPIEDLAITLLLGVDLDDKNNLIVFESSPVFNENAQKKIETYEVKAQTITRIEETF